MFSFTVTAAQVGQIEVATTVSTDTDESNDSNKHEQHNHFGIRPRGGPHRHDNVGS